MRPEETTRFSLRVRMPGWAMERAIPGNLYTFSDPLQEKVSIEINGRTVNPDMDNGYAVLKKKWAAGDRVEIIFPMDIRKVEADERVEADIGRVSIQRGPIVYCAEWPDYHDGNVLNQVFNRDAVYTSAFRPELLNGIQVVLTTAIPSHKSANGDILQGDPQEAALIPYYTWNNRGAGEMMVWLPVSSSSARPLPGPTIAGRSRVSASKELKSLIALNDQLEPSNSNDHTWPYYHWWPQNASWEWVQYNFENAETVSGMKVYWFDDGPNGGCRIPETYELLYMKDGRWIPVENETAYTVTKDAWNELEFKPVTTTALRMRVKLPEEFSTGIHEWVID